ncbi:alpha/beta hydrolase [Cognatishimia sp. WU-CL00825]|uniref:alpha/beta fold hydrolase n=1 Tax=Cognatishimia sp. WU-CL00825 TaxID=3127658 RepID=UPI003104E662
MAEAIVFLPGILCDARLFGPQIAELSAQFTVISAPVAADDTMTAMATRALNSLPNQFALVGAGLGGVVAMEILRLAPERVTRLCLIATSPLQGVPLETLAYEPLLVAARAGRIDEVVTHLSGHDPAKAQVIDADVLALLQDMALAIGVPGFVNQVRAVQRQQDMQAVLRKSNCPTQIIFGLDDPFIMPKRYETLAAFIPDAQLTALPHASVVPSLEAPAEVTRALKAWMARPLVLRHS